MPDLSVVVVGPPDGERRLGRRHRVNGSAVLTDGHGVMHHVRLVDLSAGGARLTRPASAELIVGATVGVTGPALPWERRGTLVALGDAELHVRFD